jgi:hypothetical protein
VPEFGAGVWCRSSVSEFGAGVRCQSCVGVLRIRARWTFLVHDARSGTAQEAGIPVETARSVRGTQTAVAREDMSNVGEIPSLIDDVDFLAELDKLETNPAPARSDVHSAHAHHASRSDDADQGRVFAVLPGPAPVAAGAPVRRSTLSAKPARPVPLEKPLRLETPPAPGPGRIDRPSRPDAPARPERPVRVERPVRPAHVDEIGEIGQAHPTGLSAVSGPQPRRVSAGLTALTIVLCLGVGAGSAAMMFHDRVAQVVATWKK